MTFSEGRLQGSAGNHRRNQCCSNEEGMGRLAFNQSTKWKGAR